MNYYSILKDIRFYKKPLHISRALLAKYFLTINHKTVIGVTGSVGKTTTTQAISSVLEPNSISTSQNLDSIFNIPITILKSKSFKFLVLEMGVQYPGDMDFNVSVAPPDIAVFTRISHAHTEFLTNLETILVEKSKIITPKTRMVIYNYDDNLLRKHFSDLKISTLSFGTLPGSDFRFKVLKSSLENTKLCITYKNKTTNLTVKLIGPHQAFAISAAFAVGTYLKINPEIIVKNLERTQSPHNRFNVVKHRSAYFIKDIYNSSPQALSDAIDFMDSLKGPKKIAYLGDMLELGKSSDKQHLLIAKKLLKSDLDEIYTYGQRAQEIHQFLVKHHSKAKLKHLIKPLKIDQKTYPAGTVILVKGSHGMHMEDFFSR